MELEFPIIFSKFSLSVSTENDRYLLNTNGSYSEISPELSGFLEKIQSHSNTVDEFDMYCKNSGLTSQGAIEGLQKLSLVGDGIDNKKHGLDGFIFTLDLLSSKSVTTLSKPFTILFSKSHLVILAVLLFCCFGMYSEEIRVIEFNQFMFLSDPILIFIIYFFSVLFHEIGHASALVKYTDRAGEIGFGLYYIFPVLYADVNESWTLTKSQRSWVSFGGVFFQLIFLLVVISYGIVFESATAISASNLITISIIFTLNPLFKFDGYWILCDVLDVNNLHRYVSRGLFSFSAAGVKNVIFSYCYLGIAVLYILLIISFLNNQFTLLVSLYDGVNSEITIMTLLGSVLGLVLMMFMLIGVVRISMRTINIVSNSYKNRGLYNDNSRGV
ncbi:MULTISPECIES: hypothetical protein [unclassified Colwellia]|jgi:putative peptide zinc metalloprotease protein|uniref:hypothetical protein n=1 Tax=unclassified Colwellia TaxID=196834 RepID=UPI0015F5BD35|nr:MULTISPECIES: hypothetical protein [unclassified Colwellia]MBA6231891.1 hypothetical protein [Colwellia sp. MB02u-7]MBA6235936.1 hypothetical protein [Colwellia sp. MB02u-11]MBA6255228.1 hypothetical protein [Colwellia sp. MB3u-28]MBA6258607.1 hypothetical protein [Colwellia sp. MB3u-41]MBA6298648.1 hypothetical protein [Colwellia sp. MB3u-22]